MFRWKLSNWEMVRLDIKVGATWLPDLKLALKLKGSKWIRKLTGQNGDADGHSLHLGPWPKVNNVQGAIWLRLGKGRGCRRVREGRWVKGRVATSTSIWKSRFFLSLQRSGKANVSMRCVHAWLCCNSAPPPGPPCSATEYGQQWHCGTPPQGRGKHHSAPDHPHACMYTNTSCTPCSFSHKRYVANTGLSALRAAR